MPQYYTSYASCQQDRSHQGRAGCSSERIAASRAGLGTAPGLTITTLVISGFGNAQRGPIWETLNPQQRVQAPATAPRCVTSRLRLADDVNQLAYKARGSAAGNANADRGGSNAFFRLSVAKPAPPLDRQHSTSSRYPDVGSTDVTQP
jgi:hypothetical protein